MTRKPGYEKLEKRIRELEETVQKYQQQEIKLREDHSFRTSVIMRATEGICVCHEINEHPYVRFTVWNDQMKELTGYAMEEINRLGWYQSVYTDPDVQERAIKRMEQMRLGGDLIREEWEITRKDREKRTLYISTSILETADGKTHTLGMMNDVTERKKAENILKKSHADLERQVNQRTAELIEANEVLKDEITKQQSTENALLENQSVLEETQALAHMGSWEWDVRTNANIWSDEMYRIFGQKPDSFVPNYDNFAAAVHPADKDRVLEAVQVPGHP